MTNSAKNHIPIYVNLFASVLLISVALWKLHVSKENCLVHLSLAFTITSLHGDGRFEGKLRQ